MVTNLETIRFARKAANNPRQREIFCFAALKTQNMPLLGALGATMNCHDIKPFLAETIQEFGVNPYGFFHILRESDKPAIDLHKANEFLEDLKSEDWHSLKMEDYVLWAISDNGDYLWWNGEQTVAMNPRGSEFMSVPVQPRQFIRLVGMGKITGIFPEELWRNNA